MIKNSCYIIAEIGINHNGKLKIALDLIKKAKKAGASAVKFQIYSPETLGKKNDHRKIKIFRKQPPETRYQMWRRLSVKQNWLGKIKKECEKIKIDLGFSVFDEESLKKIKSINPNFIKVASSDLTDHYLIKKIIKCKKKIIISTGMSLKKEILNTVKILSKKNFVLLHCVSLYPTEYKKVNLNRMIKLKKIHKHVGFSDHSKKSYACLKAIDLGAEVLEKHFTFNKDADGPDHKGSANFDELKLICDYSKIHSQLMGDGKIEPSRLEKKNRFNARKSIWAKKNIKKNEFFSIDNIEKTRPGIGIGVEKFEKILNTKSKFNLKKGELIKI